MKGRNIALTHLLNPVENQANMEERIKINRALRSLYRLEQYGEMYPECIVDFEKEILRETLLELNPIQIQKVSDSWEEYKIREDILLNIDSISINNEFEKYLNQLN